MISNWCFGQSNEQIAVAWKAAGNRAWGEYIIAFSELAKHQIFQLNFKLKSLVPDIRSILFFLMNRRMLTHNLI